MDLMHQNMIGAVLLTIQAILFLALLVAGEPDFWGLLPAGKPEVANLHVRRFKAFLAFWTLANFLNVIDWFSPENNKDPTWFDLGLDTLENFALAFAAYSLLSNEDFRWMAKDGTKDGKNLIIAGLGTFAAVLLMGGLVAFFIQGQGPFVKALYFAPNMLMASSGFIFLGIGIIRNPETGLFRWPTMVIFVVYGVVQLPNYIRWVDRGVFTLEDKENLWRIFALGKLALLLVFTAIAVSYVWSRQPEEKKIRFENLISRLQKLAWLIAGLYTAITSLFPFIVRYFGK